MQTQSSMEMYKAVAENIRINYIRHGWKLILSVSYSLLGKNIGNMVYY